MGEIATLLLYTTIGSLAGLIGGLVLLIKKNWAKKISYVSIPLAAGVLLSVSFLDLFPHAVEEIGESAFSIILVIFVLLFLIERFILYFHHHMGSTGERHMGHSHAGETSVPLILLGDTIHNFLDGVAIGTSFLISPPLAFVVTMSTFMHETPHEIADFGILLAKGWNPKKVFTANLFSALATFPGAILAYLYADSIESGAGVMLAVATGFFLYVATTDFLPDATHAASKYLKESALYLLLGVAAVLVLNTLMPEIGH